MNLAQLRFKVLQFRGQTRNSNFQLAVVGPIFQYAITPESKFNLESDLRSAMYARYYTYRVKLRLDCGASIIFAELVLLRARAGALCRTIRNSSKSGKERRKPRISIRGEGRD
jgi:hypothetical protein